MLIIKFGLSSLYPSINFSKPQPTVQEEQLLAANSYLRTEPLGRWSFSHSPVEPGPVATVGEGLHEKLVWADLLKLCGRIRAVM